MVNKKIADLVSYKDALVSNSTQPHGSQHTLHSRKRGRSRTPSRSPSITPASSPCRSPWPEAERRRETARGGKGKERRRSYSRSPTPEHRRRTARTPERAIPGLAFREDRRRSLLKGREFSPARTPSRRPSPRSPPRSPSWQVATSRRRSVRR